jgi:hypothetical protein
MVTLGMFLNRSPIVCVRRRLRVWDTILEAAPTRPKPECAIKKIRKRALQHHNPDALIDLEFPAEFVEFLRQNFIKKIYRRVIDADECNSRIKPEPETFVIRISHGSGSISVTVPDDRSVREKTSR